MVGIKWETHNGRDFQQAIVHVFPCVSSFWCGEVTMSNCLEISLNALFSLNAPGEVFSVH